MRAGKAMVPTNEPSLVLTSALFCFSLALLAALLPCLLFAAAPRYALQMGLLCCLRYMPLKDRDLYLPYFIYVT